MMKNIYVGSYAPCPHESGASSIPCNSLTQTTTTLLSSFKLSSILKVWLWYGVSFLVPCVPAFAQDTILGEGSESHSIPILGVTFDQEWEPVGMVAEVLVRFERREDKLGLRVQFDTSPGRFSPLAKDSVLRAILHVAKASHLTTESWTVTLTLPYPGVTMYGESLSGMVGLSVLALARGDPLPPDRVMTGTIASDGHIGIVGGIPLKIQAAYANNLRRVLIPEERDVADGDWRTPFLMEVSPVGNVQKAYFALTGQPLVQSSTVQSSATLVKR